MSLGKLLDLSIKAAEYGEAKKDKCYKIDGRQYENYMDNKSWALFVAEMKAHYPSAYHEYGEGSGDELGLKKARRFPPKMASYGSSSRMIYLLARDNPLFQFEKKLPTTIGGIANMDGYLNQDNIRYYVEAKCREPYTRASFVIDRKYEELYKYLNLQSSLDFECKIENIDDKKMKVQFFIGKNQITHFDIKQMICHLLGIATEQVKNPTDEKINFIYLLYNPNKIEILPSKKNKLLLSTYEQETKECDCMPFAELYQAVIHYLIDKTKIAQSTLVDIQKISNNFSFQRYDQENFKKLVNKV